LWVSYRENLEKKKPERFHTEKNVIKVRKTSGAMGLSFFGGTKILE